MSLTIDYDIKRAMPFLAKDNRWNVLTVLMLHANVRNRCWPSMDVVTEMATNGNRTKANRAKKWLEQHGAFEVVPNDKRVEDELKLSARQTVYQMTGMLRACQDATCDCKHDGQVYHYLYLGKANSNSDNGHRLNGETINSLNGETMDRLNGETGSITNEVLPDEVRKHVAKRNRQRVDLIKSLPDQFIDIWAHETKYMGNNMYSVRWAAKKLLELNPPASIGEIETVCRLKMVNRTTEYKFIYLLDDIPARRKQLAEQAKAAENATAAQAKVDEERRRNRILWGLESEVVEDAS